MDAIEVVELEQGLPHPMLNGVWIKRAPERFASYLMVYGLSQKNVDQVIELAKGGFGCVEMAWWRTTPSYEPNPEQFPDGLAGLKMVADKIHAAGLQVGLHAMQGMVGWGDKNDPYIVPKADPRLLQDRQATLAAPLTKKPRRSTPASPPPAGPTAAICTPKARSSATPNAWTTVLPSASAVCMARPPRLTRPPLVWAIWSIASRCGAIPSIART